jgi:hypothetical protein
MENTRYHEPQATSFTEHLVFVALLLPTFVVLAAAVVSLAGLESTLAVDKSIVTAAACEPCPGRQDGDEGP